jgi:hypothetical protein
MFTNFNPFKSSPCVFIENEENEENDEYVTTIMENIINFFNTIPTLFYRKRESFPEIV